ncbi:hypothetical protein JOL79_15290 [Microbispora sp. RL4-1S]|uniref:Uncharacterized protein n=1 Tax=Microbispora oryzae TaxID=2806554 RepID=A0A941AQU5_9ACTN|nr:hypothetical protein [Microbispora oryzae]MBP2705179.1 hypothetical protein [Microbispora oryzae]
MTPHDLSTAPLPRGPSGAPGASGLDAERPRPGLRRPEVVLALIAVAYAVIQLVVLPHTMSLEWDEAVYTSQVAPMVPDADFSAPRARGITWLVAPVAHFTVDPTAIRLWLTLVSAAGLFLAFLPWCSLLRGRVLALAAGLFATLWVTIWYGDQVMPNLYVAYGCLLAAGCSVLTARDRRSGSRSSGSRRSGSWWAWAGLAAGVAGVALLRPGDALWLALPLGVTALVRRDVRALAVVSAAVAAGFLPWVIEGFQRFGGPLERWRAAGEVQGGIAPAPGFLYEFKTANGPAFCRPCTTTLDDPQWALWWLVLPLLAICGAVVARSAAHAVAAVTGLCVAVPYLFLVDYSAPRFLLPAYALLAIPAAEALVRVAGRRPVPLASALVRITVAIVLAAHVAVQAYALRDVSAGETKERGYQAGIVKDMVKLGVHAPCTLVGRQVNPAMALIARCDALSLGAGRPVPDLSHAPEGHVFAVLTKDVPPPGAEKWKRHVLRRSGSRPTWVAYIRP